MTRLVGVPTFLWVLLSAATVVSWLIGIEAGGGVLAGAAILAIAFVKLRLVGIHFMEIGRAPVALRAIFEGYVVVAFASLLVIYTLL